MGLSLQDIVFLNKGHSNKTSPKQYVASFTNYPSQKKKGQNSSSRVKTQPKVMNCWKTWVKISASHNVCYRKDKDLLLQHQRDSHSNPLSNRINKIQVSIKSVLILLRDEGGLIFSWTYVSFSFILQLKYLETDITFPTFCFYSSLCWNPGPQAGCRPS